LNYFISAFQKHNARESFERESDVEEKDGTDNDQKINPDSRFCMEDNGRDRKSDLESKIKGRIKRKYI
jgi:hypothetical protein